MIGKHLRSKTRMPMMTNLQTVVLRTESLKSWKGVQAPIEDSDASQMICGSSMSGSWAWY